MLQFTLDLNTEIKEINNLSCGDEFFISQIWRDCYNKQITVTLTKKNYPPKDNKSDIKNLLTFGDDDEYRVIGVESITDVNINSTVK